MTNDEEEKNEETYEEAETGTDGELVGSEEKYEDSKIPGAVCETHDGVLAAVGEEATNDGAASEEVANGEEATERKKNHLPADAPWLDRMREVFVTFWPLGFIAFGGPVAHVAILKDRLVDQLEWLDEDAFMELFAIGQGLPGPTSTQLVISAALSRAGPLGGLLAFFLWNLPGMIVLTVCGALIATFVDPQNPPWYLIGLPAAAIALVFKAFYAFAMKLDTLGIIVALCSSLVAILINNDARISTSSSQFMFPALLVLGACVTFADSKRSTPLSSYGSPSPGWERESEDTMKRIGIPLWMGLVFFLTWLFVLIVSILLVSVWNIENVYLNIFETMFRIGSLIFGGGQVVLPMLQDEVVPFWMTRDQFLQGLGLAQSMPGPLFNFSAYLGAVYQGVPGALIAFIGLFGPGVILIFAIAPVWARLRHVQTFRVILKGLNATAIGFIGAACVTLWESAISTSADAMVFAIALTLCVAFNVPAPLVIFIGGVVGAILHPDALDIGQQPYCIDQGFVEPAQ